VCSPAIKNSMAARGGQVVDLAILDPGRKTSKPRRGTAEGEVACRSRRAEDEGRPNNSFSVCGATGWMGLRGEGISWQTRGRTGRNRPPIRPNAYHVHKNPDGTGLKEHKIGRGDEDAIFQGKQFSGITKGPRQCIKNVIRTAGGGVSTAAYVAERGVGSDASWQMKEDDIIL